MLQYIQRATKRTGTFAKKGDLFSHPRLGQWGRGLFFIAISFALIFSAIYTPLEANAIKASDMSPTEEVKSYLYYNALSYCINNRMLKDTSAKIHNRITEEHAKAGTYFYTNARSTNPDIAYVLTAMGVTIATDKDQGVLCDDSGGWVLDAASLWGYSGGIDLLCDMGKETRANGSDCRDGNGEFNGFLGLYGGDQLKVSVFQDNIKNKVYSGKEPSLSDAARYILAQDAFYTGCLGRQSGSATSLPDAYTGSATGDYLYTGVKLVDSSGDGSIANNGKGLKLYGVKRQTDSFNYYMDYAGGGNKGASCEELVKQINQYAAPYSTWIQNNSTADSTGGATSADTGNSTGEDTTTTSTCNIDGVGWILCPALTFISKLSDQMYGIISSWLKVDSNLYSDSSGTKNGWNAIRDVANVGIVIVFLLVVMSQLTSFGISNYGIKKILPRLVLIAIVINLSYYIMQIALDISNILGGTLYSFLTSLPVFQDGIGWLNKGNMFTDILATVIGGQALAAGTIAVVAGTAVTTLYGGIGFFILILLSGIIAIGVFFLTLALRQALVVILVILAPLAFLAAVLPNTQNIYKKWQKMFVSVLTIYPMAAVLFGGSQLAASVILQNSTTSGDAISGIMTAIMGLGVAVVPLFAIIPAIKTSLNALPIIGGAAQKIQGKLSAPVNKAAKSRFTDAKKGMMDHSTGAALTGRFGKRVQSLSRSKLRRENRLSGYTQAADREATEYMAKYTANDPTATQAQRSVARMKLSKLNEEEAKAVKIQLDLKPDGTQRVGAERIEHLQVKLAEAIRSNDSVLAEQATIALRTSGAPGRKALEKTLLQNDNAISGANSGSAASRAIRNDLLSNNIKANNNGLATWAAGTSGSLHDVVGTEGADGRTTGGQNTLAGLTASEQASQDTHVLQRQADAGFINAKDAEVVLRNEGTSSALTSEKRALFESAAPQRNQQRRPPIIGSRPP